MFPLPGPPSSPSAQAPPLILLLPPLTGAHAVNVMSTVPLLLQRARGGYLKWHHSPLVSASLQFAQISLLLLVGLLQLSQVDAVFHFYCIQHIQRHFTKQLKGPDKSITFSRQAHFYLGTISACRHRTGSSFLCRQLYFLLESSVLGKSMCDCFSMASNKICLLASRRQSRPFNSASGQEAEGMTTFEYLHSFINSDERKIMTPILNLQIRSCRFYYHFSQLTFILAQGFHFLLGHLTKQGHALQRHHLQGPGVTTVW